jgi:hypothetical protein
MGVRRSKAPSRLPGGIRRSSRQSAISSCLRQPLGIGTSEGADHQPSIVLPCGMVVSPACSHFEGRGAISLHNPAATRPWQHVLEAAPHAHHEAGRLHLQIDKAHHQLCWQPRWDLATTVPRWRTAWRIWRPKVSLVGDWSWS